MPIVETAPRHRFRRQQRLTTAADYGRVFRQAKRSSDQLFTVLCRPDDRDAPRLGLAISKKHCKHAFQRNRIKRVVRESFRLNQHALPGLDIVVMNKPQTHRASSRQLHDSLEAHWKTCSKANTHG